MKYEIVELEEKKVMGLCARTGNSAKDMTEVIGSLWGNLYQPETLKKYGKKTSEYAIGLYSDYNEDEYDVTVGFCVEEQTAKDLTIKVIPAGKYAKFCVHGDMVKAVGDAWGQIWQMDLPRTYTGDFEEYTNGDPKNCDINIYIAIQ